MGAGDAKRVEEVAHAVVDYLRQHPNAMDSFEGIARFWIPRQRLQTELATLELAMNGLVETKVLEVFELESKRFFRLPAAVPAQKSEG